MIVFVNAKMNFFMTTDLIILNININCNSSCRAKPAADKYFLTTGTIIISSNYMMSDLSQSKHIFAMIITSFYCILKRIQAKFFSLQISASYILLNKGKKGGKKKNGTKKRNFG